MKTWRAAQLDVSGIERLAIMGFRGDAGVSQLTLRSTHQRLTQSRFYHVLHLRSQVAKGEISLPTEPRGLQEIIAYGRRCRADAVLVGQVHRELDRGTQLGGVNFRVGDPKLAVVIQYYVVDVHTGDIRGQGKIARRMTEQDFARNGGLTDQTADNFVRTCVQEMVSQITAGSGSATVDLARMSIGKGSPYIDQGNELAEKGEWREAAKNYSAALKVNPDSHEALYNLGIAAEAEGRFDEAKAMYTKAIAKDGDSLYREALSRVVQSKDSYQLACQQISRRPRRHVTPGRHVQNQQVARLPRHDQHPSGLVADRISRGNLARPESRPASPSIMLHQPPPGSGGIR